MTSQVMEPSTRTRYEIEMFTTLVVALGVLNLVPGAAAFHPAWLERLYGVRVDQSGLRVVMRHRAVLLGCVGLGLITAAFEPAWVAPAFAFALISKVGFLALFVLEGRPAGPLVRVARADAIALPLLALAVWMR